MDHTFMTEGHIVDVRHLHNIKIPLSRTDRKHLILTGKNGSGKTSVLKSLTVFLRDLLESDDFQLDDSKIRIAELKDKLRTQDNPERRRIHLQIKNLEANARRRWNDGCVVTVNSPLYMRERFKKGQFILAYYRDNRQLDLGVGVDYSKVELKSVYGIDEHPAGNIGKYLLNLKMTQGLAKLKMDEASGTERLELQQRMQDIDSWFNRFTDVLRDIYDESKLKLDFDIDTHQFRIVIPNRDPFTLDCMSMGYAAIFDIVGDLMMRMEGQHTYELEGIVLIDEIETHLHVELQRAIVPILIKLFPNLQFVLTTHSPFILNSTENAVVYDLENNSYLPDGMTDLPYEGIVESYFNVKQLSESFIRQFNRFKELIQRVELTDEEYAELDELQFYLDKIPEYLSLDFAEEYFDLKESANL